MECNDAVPTAFPSAPHLRIAHLITNPEMPSLLARLDAAVHATRLYEERGGARFYTPGPYYYKGALL